MRMSWTKRVLLVAAVSALFALWQQRRRSVNPPVELVEGNGDKHTGTQHFLIRAKSEDPKSQETLSYAFEILSNPRTAGDHIDTELTLEGSPAQLIEEASLQLRGLQENQLTERIPLLRAILRSRDPDTTDRVEDVLRKERAWFLQQAPFVLDNEVTREYVGELTRISLVADSENPAPLSEIEPLVESLADKPHSLEALKNSVKLYLPWEYENWSRRRFSENRREN
jgi:hypothetical protein